MESAVELAGMVGAGSEAGRRVGGRLEHGERAVGDGETLARQRSLFLASMGHTLRSPLNGVLGFSDILLEESAGPLNDRQRRYIERIAESGRRQLELIDNLTQLARLHSGQLALQPERCSIAQIVEDAVSSYRALAQRKGVRIEIEVSCSTGKLTADADYLTTAIRSLVSNAVRCSENGGVIKVSARRLDPELGSDDGNGNRAGALRGEAAARLRVEVADDGPGIAPEDQDLIFDDLEDHRSLLARCQRRTGVGLPLARRLVELHGGRISVHSTGVRGEGCRFAIDLPVQLHLVEGK
ncbi:MAG: HAMP domain-containing histidine kinase [Gemmatimonadota bacterium]|nr:MAG: HAMP domain-containing histidine kinase [Gemmatimonadota bacterium]